MLPDAQSLCSNLHPYLQCIRMPVAGWPCQYWRKGSPRYACLLCMCLESDLQTSLRNWRKLWTFSEKCNFTLTYLTYDFSLHQLVSGDIVLVVAFLITSSLFCLVDLGTLEGLRLKSSCRVMTYSSSTKACNQRW